MVNTPLGVRTIKWLKVKGKDRGPTQVLTYVGLRERPGMWFGAFATKNNIGWVTWTAHVDAQ